MLTILGSCFVGVSAIQHGMGDRIQSANFGAVNLPRMFQNVKQALLNQQGGYNQLGNQQDSKWGENLINLYNSEKAKCEAKAEPGQRVTFDPMCLDKQLAQISNGGLGCIEENSVPTGCRYCEFDEYSEIPCDWAQASMFQDNFYDQLKQFQSIKMDTVFPSNWRTNLINLYKNEKATCAATAEPGQRVTFDPMCLDKQLAQISKGGLGCIEDESMRTGCRYCEFGAYSEIPCDFTRFPQLDGSYPQQKAMFSRMQLQEDDDDDFYEMSSDTFLLRPTTATQGKLAYWLEKEGGVFQDPLAFSDEVKISGATTFVNGVAQLELYKPQDSNVLLNYKTWDDLRTMWSPVVRIPLAQLQEL